MRIGFAADLRKSDQVVDRTYFLANELVRFACDEAVDEPVTKYGTLASTISNPLSDRINAEPSLKCSENGSSSIPLFVVGAGSGVDVVIRIIVVTLGSAAVAFSPPSLRGELPNMSFWFGSISPFFRLFQTLGVVNMRSIPSFNAAAMARLQIEGCVYHEAKGRGFDPRQPRQISLPA